MSPFTPLSRISAWQRCLLALLLLWVGALNAHLAPREVVFIDPSVADWPVLRDGVKPGVEVVLLDAGKDGLAQMAAWAEGKSGYDAVHVLSHGSPGTVHLGAFGLNRETLGERAGELAAIGAALNEDGDLLLYGCDVASGESGKSFIDSFAKLTSADIAASINKTGASDKGGDWVLEEKIGIINSKNIKLNDYHGLLSIGKVTLWTPQLDLPINVNDGGFSVYYTDQVGAFFYGLKAFYEANNATVDAIPSGHLTSASLDTTALLFIFLPTEDFTANDITYIRNFINAGGRAVFYGENNGWITTGNGYLTSAIAQLGGQFSIRNNEDFSNTGSDTLDSSYVNSSSPLANGLSKLYYNAASVIDYSGAVDVVVSAPLNSGGTKGLIVDQAVGKGRIMLITDVNIMETFVSAYSAAAITPYSGKQCTPVTGGYIFTSLNNFYGSNCGDGTSNDVSPYINAANAWGTANQASYWSTNYPGTDTQALFLNLLTTAETNRQTVSGGGNPNAGFGGSPTTTVTASDVTIANDGATSYTFTVRYQGATASAINISTIGTNDVTVTNASGTALTITNASITSGSGTNDTTVIYTVTPPDGSWDTTDNGTYTIGIVNASVEDNAGKQVAGDSQAKTFTVNISASDTTPPTLDGANSTPADNATGVAASDNIVIDFSENIAFGSGGTITLRNVTGSADAETFDVSTVSGGTVTGSNGSAITISADKLTINPSGNLLAGTQYSVRFTVGSIEDTAGNDLAAITADTTYNFTTAAPTVTLSASPTSIVEAAASTITATLSAAAGTDTTVTIGRNNTTSTATLTADFTLSSTTIPILAGQTTGTATLTAVQDALDEDNETAIIEITGVSGGDGASESSTQEATVTITDDDAEPSLSIANASLTEGNSGTSNMTFTVTLSAASGKTVTVNYATSDVTTTSGVDYTATSGTLTFVAGETTKTFTVTITGDTSSESNETFTVTLSSPSNATLGTASATGAITNDDVATDSTVTAAAGITEPVALSTTADTVGEAVGVFDFTVTDAGTGDSLPTALTQIALSTSGTGDFSKVTWRLSGGDISGAVTGAYNPGASTITFASLSESIESGTSQTYTVSAYYSNTSGLTEGQTFILSVDGDSATNFTVGGSGSQMASGQSAVTNGSGTTVNVVATELRFGTQPSATVTSGVAFTTQPVVQATDAFGNVDTGFTGTVTLTEDGSGALSDGDASVTQNATAGVATFSGVLYTAASDADANFMLTAAATGLTSATSNSINPDVVATQLVFSTQPAPLSIQSGASTSFTTVPVVQAQDANNTVDTDYATAIVLSATNTSGGAVPGTVNSLTGTGDTDGVGTTVTLTPSSGAAIYAGLALTYTNDSSPPNSIALRTTSGGLTAANSSTITASTNAAPTATVNAITGTTSVGDTLTGSYTYADTNSDAEDTGGTGSSYQWKRGATNVAGSASNISGASGATLGANETYVITAADRGNYLFYCVTPKASAGTLTGTETCSTGLLIPNSGLTLTVTNTNDSGAGSLREAITNASTTAADTINFAAGLNGQTITLGSPLTIAKSLTIDGTGRKIVINGNGHQAFSITSGTVELKNLTVTGGSAANGGGLSNNGGTVTVRNSAFTGNTATGTGGAIHNASGDLTVINSTFASNSGTSGASLSVAGGTVTVLNSSFSGSSAGGEIAQTGGTISLTNTLIDNATLTCTGTITNGGNNLDRGTGCGFGSASGSQSSVNPLLGALGDYGGDTQILPLLPGSPAINAGTNTGCPATDQRGIARPQGTACDIGAYESQGFSFAKSGDNQSATISTAFTNPLSVTVTATGSGQVNGGKVTFTAPGSGASATLVTSPATISGGSASVTATANATAGSYQVTASAAGATSVNFSLTNSTPGGGGGEVTDDGDGITDATENGAPNGGDGNGDGFTDSQQGNVTSLPVAGGSGSYLTVQTPTGVRLANVTVQTAGQAGVSGDYPWGVLSFEAFGPSPVTITLFLPGRSTVAGLVLNKIGGGQTQALNAAFSIVQIGGQPTVVVSYSLSDNGPHDTCPASGQICDPVGVAEVTEPPEPPVTLTVTKTGGGAVTSVPAGITCGSDCSESYSVGAAVTLTATAASGYDFSGWSGGCAGAAPTCTLTLSAHRTVTATFSAIAPSLLTVTKTGNGTVSSIPSGIACGSDCSESYPVNTAVTLTATAASGSGFTGWSGGCAGTAPTCALTLSADQTVTATFSAIASPRAAIGVLRNGQWHLDRSGNSAWDQCGSDGCDAFGQAGDMPVVGNWDGGDRSLLGVLRAGTAQWFLDRNGNGQWDGCGADSCLTFGDIGDLPVAADWSGDGKAKMGVFRAGNWYLDANGNGRWDGCGIDRCYLKAPDQSAPGFGLNGDLPIVGDWTGDGIVKVGVFRAGNWYFDNGNGQWDGCEIDRCHLKNPEQPRAGFGLGGDYPVVGDWNGDGVLKIGVFRNGSWFFDNGNGQWDGCGIDACVLRIPEQPNTGFGLPGDLPAVGRW